MSATLSELGPVLSALGVGLIVAAVVNGLFSRKKMSAEAANMISSAASSVVKTVTDDMERREKVFKATMAEKDLMHTKQIRDIYEALQTHADWDRQAVLAAERAGLILPPPPVVRVPRVVD